MDLAAYDLGFSRRFSRDRDGIVTGVGAVEDDGDLFVGVGLDDQAGVVGGHGQGAAAAIHEDGELDLGWAAVIEELVERGFDGATGLKHVIHEDDSGPGDINRYEGGGELLGDGLSADIVAMEGNIYDAGAWAGALGVMFTKEELQAGGDVDAAVGDAEEDEVLGGIGGVAGGDGGGELIERASELGSGDAGWSGHGGLGCADAQTRGKARSVSPRTREGRGGALLHLLEISSGRLFTLPTQERTGLPRNDYPMIPSSYGLRACASVRAAGFD